MSRQEIDQRGGQYFLRFYSSVDEMLRAVYPEVPWESLSSRRKRTNNNRTAVGYWADHVRQRQLLDQIGSELGIKEVFLPPY